MPLVQDRSRSQLAFQMAGGDVDRFQVMRYRGSEGLCQLYRFEIELATDDLAVAFDDIVGKSAVFSINAPAAAASASAAGAHERWFHGIISRFELTNQTQDQAYFRAELVPGIWLLTHRYSSRIYQNKSVKDIVSDVLTKAGFSTDRFKFVLSGSYQPREYCVQYRETDYNFICRLLEEEGIWWYFEQTKDSHVLVMADATAAYKPITGEADVPFVPPSGMGHETEHIFRFRLGQAVRPGAVMLTDFNFKNPKLKLDAKADAGRDPSLEFFDYPGEYIDQSAGSKLAKTRIEEFEGNRIIGVAQSNSYRLAVAKTFNLIEHPIDALNATYLIIALTHQGKQATLRASTGAAGRTGILDGQVHQSLLVARQSQDENVRQLAEGLLQIAGRLGVGDASAHRELSYWIYHAGQVSTDLANVAAGAGASMMEAISLRNLIDDVAHNALVDFDAPVYECRFECIPSTVSYRPPRVTPWPVMRGAQTARVVGPSGEEIHTDEYGRVKVQFNWDREGSEGGQPKLFGADSSCWIRVAQGMAGGNYGIMFIPRVGQEVVVDFLEGDPDQPLIVGRVYNADQMPPYTLPDEKTKSVIKTHSSKGGGGNNEIRFEDLKDKEQLFIQAQKRMDTNVKADHFHSVGGSYHLTVGGEKDGQQYGEYRQLVHKLKQTHVKEERRTWIEKDDGLEVDGSRAMSVGGTLSVTVSKDVAEDYKANHKHEVAATYLCKAGADISIQAGGTLELKGAGGTITIDASGIFITGTMVNINSGSGTAVSPPSCTAAGPALVDDPAPADSSQPGKDTRYGGQALQPQPPAPPPEVPGHEWPGEEPPKKKEPSFIDILLTDEEGNPVPGERYRVTDSDNKVHEGGLDANGKAHVIVPEGECEVTFPNLDDEAWDRTS